MTISLEGGTRVPTGPGRLLLGTRFAFLSRMWRWVAHRRSVRRLEAMGEGAPKDLGIIGGMEWVVRNGRDAR